MLVDQKRSAIVDDVFEVVRAKNPHEPEFLQAVSEVLMTIAPAIEVRITVLKCELRNTEDRLF